LTKKHSEVIAAIELKMEREHQTKETTEIEREIQHVALNFAADIDLHLRKLELEFNSHNCLLKHKITPVLRSRMIDWMVEVMTNFRCDD